jgi:hypothetical protein
VRRRQRVTQLPEHLARLTNVQRSPRRHIASEVLALEQLHHEKRRARRRVEPRVEHLHHVIALDRRRDLGLAHESLARVGVRGQLGTQELQRTSTSGGLLNHRVDRAHSSFGDEGLDAIVVGEERSDD